MLIRIFTVLFLTFALQAATISESESNNNCATADAITIFDTGTGTVAKNNDPDDYWVFTTPSSAGTLLIYTTGYNNNTDSDGYLYSSTDCTNYLIRDYLVNANVNVSYSVTKNTTYYFRMNAYSGNNNPYVLNFQFTSSNHAPTITQPNNGNAYSLSVPENTTAVTDVNATDSDNDTLTYTLSGTDASKFTINSSTGVVAFASAPDYESPTDVGADNVYNITVTVTDNGYPAMSDTQNITITVTNTNEAPTITQPNDGNAYSLSVPENTTVVTDVNATDPENQTLTYALSGADASKFTINSSTGVITFAPAPDYESPTDVGADNVYNITVTVTDNGSPAMSDTQNIAITVTNTNEAPTITQPNNGSDYTLSVIENSIDVTDVNATDPENQTLTYALSGADASKFTINSSTGVITFAPAPDYESPTDVGADNIYNITVTVTDTDGLSDTQNIAITVTNINETPIVDYRFDECLSGSPVVDSSPSTLNAVAVSSPAVLMSEKICRSKTFNGTDQYLTIPTAVANRLKTTATLSFWIKTTQTGNDTMWLAPGVTGVEQSGGANDVFWGWLDANGRIGIMKGNTAGAKSTNSINDGNWHHVVLTRDSSTGLVQTYVNGVFNEQATSATGDVTTDFTSVAKIEDTGNTPTFFNGSLDEIKVYDRVLSSTEINTLYSNENSSKNYDGSTRVCTECAPSFIYDYRLDECNRDSLTVIDYGSAGNDATAKHYSGNTDGLYPQTCNDTGAIVCTNAQFKGYGYNVSYSPWYYTAKYYMEAPDVATFSPLQSGSEMTLYAWFKTSSSATQTIVTKTGSGSANSEYRLWIESGTLKFTLWDKWGAATTYTVKSGINDGNWHHVAVAVKTASGTATVNGYLDGMLQSTLSSSSYQGYPTDTSGSLYIGAMNWGGSLEEYFDGNLDELHMTGTTDSAGAIYNIYSNENLHFNYDGSTRTCPCSCSTVSVEPAINFDAWDSFRSISDRKISTKIVNKPFDLTIASLNETNDGLQNFTGTVCARLIDSAGNVLSDWNQFIFTAEQSKTATFTLARAIGGSDYAGVRLLWQKNASAATACDALSDTNTTIASDRFAVRPTSFSITAPNAVAGTDFAIVFNAPNFSGVPSVSYNESTPGTFSVSVTEQKTGCLLGTFTPSPSVFSFLNGTKTLTTRYNEVGVLDINISDLTKPCTSRFAQIDCSDANVSGSYNSDTDLPIGLAQAQISVIPHHFDVNATLSNFAGDTFTYLSDDLNMSANLRLIATAKNAEGNTTLNYTQVCYAKNTTLTLPYTSVPDPLSQILYIENLTDITNTLSKTNDIVISFDNSIFTAGVAPLDLDFNFDRSPSKPLDPFDFSFTSAQIIDSDGVNGSGTPLGNTLFVYGRVHAYDVTTNTASAPNPIEFEAYSTVPTGFVSGMPQNVLKWYRNLDHDTAAQGNVIRGGFSAGVTDAAVDTSAIPQNGVQIITVTSAEDKTVHLDISPWLWYSPKYAYDYNGACTRHPCFLYDYTNTGTGINGVNSGTFQGTDFTMEPAPNITNKGVKVFR